jgi:hypothetical protein
MANRAVYSIFIDSEIRARAKQNGLNISRITENTLRFLLQRIDDYTSVIGERPSTDSQNFSKEVEQ